jgi:hypothetical protein
MDAASRSVDRAGHILFALASPDVGRLLCDVIGWSQAQHAAWLEAMLTYALLPDTDSAKGT